MRRREPQFLDIYNTCYSALVAAVLFDIHEGWEMHSCLVLGVCATAVSLSDVTCSDGVLPYQDCLTLVDKFVFRG